MEKKKLNDNELGKVVGGWAEGAPDTITTCPCCGGKDTGAGIGIGGVRPKGIIICHNPKCRLQFEVYLDDATLTGNYSLEDRGPIDLEAYKEELREKGWI